MSKPAFWSKGIQFQCQGSGNCCVSRGDYGFVFLTLKDRRALAKLLKIPTALFTKQYCDQRDGVWKLKDAETADCTFLRDHRCSVYKARPTQCRTWPFWPEILNAKTWNGEVKKGCPGVGKGRVWSAKEVREQLEMQKQSEADYGS